MRESEKDTKIECLDRIRDAINDALSLAHNPGLAHSIPDHSPWFEPIRRFRHQIEAEIAFLHGDNSGVGFRYLVPASYIGLRARIEDGRIVAIEPEIERDAQPEAEGEGE